MYVCMCTFFVFASLLNSKALRVSKEFAFVRIITYRLRLLPLILLLWVGT
jgi:hypothetical protein